MNRDPNGTVPDGSWPLEVRDSLRQPAEPNACDRLPMPCPGLKKYVAPPCVAAATGETPGTGEGDLIDGSLCWLELGLERVR
jgi:hypothetical protein